MVMLMVLLWSFNFIIGKITLLHIDALTLVSFRLVLAGLIMLPIYLLTPRAKRFDRHDFTSLAGLSLFGAVMNQGCFTVGLNFTTAGHSSIVVGMAPIMILLLARANRLERLTAAKVGGMALSFTGVTLLALEGGFHLRSGTLAGDLITLTGSTGFALYTVYGKKVAGKYDSIAMNAFNAIGGAILLAPMAVWRGIRLDWGSVGWVGWAGTFYMAAFSSVVAYIIFYWALRYMAPSRLAAISYVEPLIVILLGVFLLGEKLTPHLLGGGALVLAGVYLSERTSGEHSVPPDIP